MNGNVGMGITICEKSWKQGNALSNTFKDTSTITRNPLPELCREGLRMIVLVSLLVLLRDFLVSMIFRIVFLLYIPFHSIE